MSALVWTDERPKVAGPWWVKCREGASLAIDADGTTPGCRDVLGHGPRIVDVTLVWGGMEVRDFQTGKRGVWVPMTALWAGPIEPPTSTPPAGGAGAR